MPWRAVTSSRVYSCVRMRRHDSSGPIERTIQRTDKRVFRGTHCATVSDFINYSNSLISASYNHVKRPRCWRRPRRCKAGRWTRVSKILLFHCLLCLENHTHSGIRLPIQNACCTYCILYTTYCTRFINTSLISSDIFSI